HWFVRPRPDSTLSRSGARIVYPPIGTPDFPSSRNAASPPLFRFRFEQSLRENALMRRAWTRCCAISPDAAGLGIDGVCLRADLRFSASRLLGNLCRRDPLRSKSTWGSNNPWALPRAVAGRLHRSCNQRVSTASRGAPLFGNRGSDAREEASEVLPCHLESAIVGTGCCSAPWSSSACRAVARRTTPPRRSASPI